MWQLSLPGFREVSDELVAVFSTTEHIQLGLILNFQSQVIAFLEDCVSRILCLPDLLDLLHLLPRSEVLVIFHHQHATEPDKPIVISVAHYGVIFRSRIADQKLVDVHPVQAHLGILLDPQGIQGFLCRRIRQKRNKAEAAIIVAAGFVPILRGGFLAEGEIRVEPHRCHATAVSEDSLDLLDILGNADC